MTAWFFGDGFDLYAAAADMAVGGTHWDTSSNINFVDGRYANTQGIQLVNGVYTALTKSSNANHANHKLTLSAKATQATFSGTNLYAGFTFWDGTTAQCSIVFRTDGSIVLTSGAPSGTILATYSGAFPAVGVWYALEFAVVIDGSAGSFAVRRSGNIVNDFSATGLNTKNSANAYANKLTVSNNHPSSNGYALDDVLWRSDTTPPGWSGDLRCYIRRPVSDQGVAWTPSGSVARCAPMGLGLATSNQPPAVGWAWFQPFVASYTGAVGSVDIQCTTAATANLKAAIFAASAGVPSGAPLATATAISNPALGTVTFTFPTPANVTQGTSYYFAFASDTSAVGFASDVFGNGNYHPLQAVISYASFPPASAPSSASFSTGNAYWFQANITPAAGANSPMVCEPLEDGATSYVYSSSIGNADLYGLSPISLTPASVYAVVTRALAQKSDAGTRIIALNLKSGATSSAGANFVLNTSWGWGARIDLTDPATGAAWTPVGVNNLLAGQSVIA